VPAGADVIGGVFMKRKIPASQTLSPKRAIAIWL
jgi:hypothetical protein